MARTPPIPPKYDPERALRDSNFLVIQDNYGRALCLRKDQVEKVIFPAKESYNEIGISGELSFPVGLVMSSYQHDECLDFTTYEEAFEFGTNLLRVLNDNNEEVPVLDATECVAR